MTAVESSLADALRDRYVIARELGRGGMATVYLAHDQKHDRSVALKLLDRELAAALGPERFLREIKLTASLDHPHILPGDLALVVGEWSFAGTGPDGEPVKLVAKNADVLRRQSDGSWRFVIDNPWGTE